MSTEKKAGFRARMREWFEKTVPTQNFDNIDPFQQSQWMTKFYATEVLRVLSPGQVPDDDDDLDLCIVDGKNDVKVDFICRSESRVVIVQSKYRKHGATEKDAEIDSFFEVLSRLHPKAPERPQLNQRLRDAISDIDWDGDTFELCFATTSKVTPAIRMRVAQGQRHLPFAADLEQRVELSLLDESDLNTKWREAEAAGQGIEAKVVLTFEQPSESGTPWVTYADGDGHTSYVGLVSATRLRELYDQHKLRLFNLNIRNYVGDTRTNRAITASALTEPRAFFFYNNGIAAVGTGIEEDRKARTLTCRQFSVVNGAQTLRSLHKAHSDKPESAGKAVVLMRLTSVSLSPKENETSFLDNVTKYNNTQNAVRVSDFRSNDPVQTSLAKYFKDVYRGGKQVWYKNKRTVERDPRKHAIGMEEFAKSIYAFRYGPVDAAGGTAHLFDTSVDGGYAKVFGSDGEIWDSLDKVQFRELAGMWFLCEGVRSAINAAREKLARELPAELAKKVGPALERRWMMFFVVGELLRTRYSRAGKDLIPELRNLSDPSVADSPAIREVMSAYTLSAARKMVRDYARASSAAGFAHRNWFRADETLRGLKENVALADDIDSLPLLRAR